MHFADLVYVEKIELVDTGDNVRHVYRPGHTESSVTTFKLQRRNAATPSIQQGEKHV